MSSFYRICKCDFNETWQTVHISENWSRVCFNYEQEARTLEMNNVQDGTWHGRGDTICIGSYSEGNRDFFKLHQPPVSTKWPERCIMQKSRDGVITLEPEKLWISIIALFIPPWLLLCAKVPTSHFFAEGAILYWLHWLMIHVQELVAANKGKNIALAARLPPCICKSRCLPVQTLDGDISGPCT